LLNNKINEKLKKIENKNVCFILNLINRREREREKRNNKALNE
jgi:hypothetical protein